MRVLAAEVRRYPAYTLFHRVIHWLVAALLAIQFATAFTLERAEGAAQDRVFIAHFSFGVLIALLMVARIVSRFAAPPAPLDAPIPGWQKGAAHTVHALLYVLLIVQPVLGYVGKSAFGGAISFFGIVDLPPVMNQNRDVAEVLFEVHTVLGFAIIALVAIHASAAFHHMVRGDRVFGRMVSGS